MMAGYWVVRAGEIRDQDAFDEYVRRWPAMVEKYHARTIASRKRHETKEGSAPARVTLVEFPTYEDALACYEDPDYQEALAFVQQAGERELVIVEGM